MLSFLFFILFFVLVLGLIIITSVFGFIRSIFSFGKAKHSGDTQNQNFGQPTSKSKIFEEKEGEYVDFEEIKEK